MEESIDWFVNDRRPLGIVGVSDIAEKVSVSPKVNLPTSGVT